MADEHAEGAIVLAVLFFIAGLCFVFALADWAVEAWHKRNKRSIARANAKLDLDPHGKRQ